MLTTELICQVSKTKDFQQKKKTVTLSLNDWYDDMKYPNP